MAFLAMRCSARFYGNFCLLQMGAYMLRSLSALISWLLRAWPILSLGPILLAHATAHRLFPADPILVNKITGTVLQVVGGVIVLCSVNSNLGLFRGLHFGKVIFGWFRAFPLFHKPKRVSLSGACHAEISGSIRLSVGRATSTIEEKVAELERQFEEFQEHVREDFGKTNARIADIHSKLSKAVAENTTKLDQLASKLERSTVGGFKQQAFGVFLAVYGAVTSVFA